MVKNMKSFIAAAVLVGAGMIAGCSSSPSAEQLAQLENLKQQAKSLSSQLQDKQRQKGDLEKQIANKNGKLQQCQADQDAVKKALGK